MVLLFFGQPVLLVIIYAALGALFLPFLAITLLWLLNSGRVGRQYRNKIFSNLGMAVALLLFAVLAIQEQELVAARGHDPRSRSRFFPAMVLVTVGVEALRLAVHPRNSGHVPSISGGVVWKELFDLLYALYLDAGRYQRSGAR